MAIVTRLSKGSKLTIEEMDNNLLSLETDISGNVSAITSKLDKGAYTGSAKDLENSIIAAVTGASGISIVPTSPAPTGTGIASFTATQAGTYTNYGGVVVNVNSFAVISRSAAGVFSISQTALDLTTYQKKSDTTVVYSKNLFNKDAVVNNKYLATDTGLTFDFTGAKTSEKIPVTASAQYTISGQVMPITGNMYLALRYEDVNSARINHIVLNVNTPITFTTPANCAFIVFNVFRPDYPQNFSLIQVELGAVATTFSAYYKINSKINLLPILADYLTTENGVKTLLQYLTEGNFVKGSPSILKTDLGDKSIQQYITEKGFASATSIAITMSKNLFNKATIVVGTFIGSSTGAMTAGANWATSDFIAVDPSTTYTISGRSGYSNVAYYNASKVLITPAPMGYASWNSGIMNGLFITDANTAFIRMIVIDNNSVGTINTTQFEKGSLATSYEAYSEDILIDKINGLKIYSEKSKSVSTTTTAAAQTLRVVTFGDSITALPDNWTTQFSLKSGATALTNMAISGQKIAWRAGTVETTTPPTDANDNNVLWNSIKKWEATTPTAPNAIIIALGTNDISQASPLGSFTDAFAQSEATTTQMTMANAFRKALQYLLNAYPNAQIFITTPIQSKTGGRNWTNLNNVSNILTDIAKRLDVIVIDCFNKSGIVDEYEGVGVAGRYLYDGTHPSSLGANKQGKFIANEFTKNYIL